MPFHNFEARHFTDAEAADITAAVQALHALLQPKLATLTPDERSQYGSVNEQNKLIINKVKDYYEAQPQLSSPEVDWDEFSKDYKSRSFLQNTLEYLTELVRGLDNAKILHDWDNYQAALVDYQYSKYRNDSGSAGFHTKQEELKQFFNKGPATNPRTEGEE